jgi:ribonuclease BN (tRNA processing enzyme)
MRVSVLGCSGGIGAGLRTTSLLLDDRVLIDAGTGMCDLPLEALIKLRHIFVTHSHLDHIAGIPLLVDTVFDQLDTPITIHGRRETLQALREHIFNNVIWPDFTRIPNGNTPVLRYQEMMPGELRTIGDCTLEMLPVNHVVPAVGYRVSGPDDAALAFSGDTTSNDEFWGALNRHPSLNVLIVEAAFPDEDVEIARLAHHYCPSLLSRDMAKLHHQPRVYVTHLKAGGENEILRQCRQAMPERAIEPLVQGAVFDL